MVSSWQFKIRRIRGGYYFLILFCLRENKIVRINSREYSIIIACSWNKKIRYPPDWIPAWFFLYVPAFIPACFPSCLLSLLSLSALSTFFLLVLLLLLSFLIFFFITRSSSTLVNTIASLLSFVVAIYLRTCIHTTTRIPILPRLET